MTVIRNWRDARVTPNASVLFNNPRRAITWLVHDERGAFIDRQDTPTPPGKTRISDLPMSPDVNCLRTLQFVHRATITPGEIHAPEAHLHPDAEEVFVILSGRGEFALGDERQAVGPGDFVYIPPGVLHALRNTGDEPLEFIDFNAPVGEALRDLLPD